jgi:glutamate dehydrogenase/leucine dehydrogenase
MSVTHEITDLMARRGHEQVVFVADASSGLRAVIAIHSTALGPSLGGVRFWHYGSEADAVADVLRLSEAMTYKAAVAGLDQGGGKTVVMIDDPDRPRDEALLLALGRAIDELGGRYLAAEDVGATPRDMDVIARVTPWVTGLDESLGGSGDPSPVTAVGVRAAMRAVRDVLDGTRSLDGIHVVVHGTGHVGSHLARLLAADGARLTLADRAPRRAEVLAAELGAACVEPDVALELECDVLAPCALGPVIDLTRVASLRCRAICGAANNQLSALDVDDALAARGILYAPDFVVNAGGIINLAEERATDGYSRERALVRAERIETTTATVFARAHADHVPPGRAAEALARERIGREGKGHWRPEDSTPWRTHLSRGSHGGDRLDP